MPKVAPIISENQLISPEPKAASTATHGAYTFASILKCYVCATGPRVGWTKFSDGDKRAIVNKHLERDGKPPISRRTFYNWKRQAIDAGLVDFQSGARRRAKRRRAARGRWMAVVTVPARVEWRTGRPPKEGAKRCTIGAVAESKGCTFGEVKRSSDQEQRSKSRSERPRPERERNPQPAFSSEVIEAEKELTGIASKVSEVLDVPWTPLEEKRSWRLATIARLAKASPDDWFPEACVLTVGMTVDRAADIKRCHEQTGGYHGFWEVAEADPIARVLSNRESPTPGWYETRYRRGAKWLWNAYGIDCEAEGFDGIHAPPPSRAEEIHQEAAVGS